MNTGNQETVKILYVNGGKMDMGGISSYMMNYYRHIDKTKVRIDFVVHGDDKGVYDDEIVQAGSVIYRVPVKSQNYLSNAHALRKIFNTEKYNIVHAHLDAGSYHILKIAQRCNVPVRIAHSHNTDYLTANKFKRIVNDYYRKKIGDVATHKMACSSMAGDWLFGYNNKYTIVRNAIEIDRYVYSEINRKEIRKELKISDEMIVLGHVGRFDDQKNHLFLLNVFSKVVKKNNKYRLILVGDGKLRGLIESEIERLQLTDYVNIIGYTMAIEKYYSAFDLFVFPSKFEGLGMVAVEAQVSGLPCILSETIPQDAAIVSVAKRISLDSELWVQQILNTEIKRYNNIKAVVDAGYDITVEASRLQKIYVDILNGW